MVRLEHLGDRKPGQLSGGQRQRVALARSLVMRPKVLLLDEPLGALDLKLRQAMQIELKEIQQEVSLTFIYVTHDQEEALTMSDRLAVFNQGKVEQVGSPAEVYERPATGVRRRVHRRLERARGRGGRAASPGATTRSPSVRRRSRSCRWTRRRTRRTDTATGRVREVVYLGAVTRYIVELDGGGELVVMQQNLTTSSMEALQVRGKAVRLRWDRSNNRPVETTGGNEGSWRTRKRGLYEEGQPMAGRRCRARVGRGGMWRRHRRTPGGGGDDVTTFDAIGEGEGSLQLIAWHGYTEDGTTEGYEEYDWVTPFEDETGCQVDVTYADSSDEMVQLMRQGGGATLRRRVRFG